MVNRNQPITPWQYSIDPVTGGAVATFNGQVVAPGMGGGNVTGPASAVDDNLAAFNGTTGKLLKDSGVSAASFDLAGAATAALASANTYTDGVTANFIDGPAGATDGNLSTFNGSSGLLVQDCGINFIAPQMTVPDPFNLVGVDGTVGAAGGSISFLGGGDGGMGPGYFWAQGGSSVTNGIKGGDSSLRGGGAFVGVADGGDVILEPGAGAGGGNNGSIKISNAVSSPGASLGTLTNAPNPGDPQTWLKVKINGTDHFIPAWHT